MPLTPHTQRIPRTVALQEPALLEAHEIRKAGSSAVPIGFQSSSNRSVNGFEARFERARVASRRQETLRLVSSTSQSSPDPASCQQHRSRLPPRCALHVIACELRLQLRRIVAMHIIVVKAARDDRARSFLQSTLLASADCTAATLRCAPSTRLALASPSVARAVSRQLSRPWAEGTSTEISAAARGAQPWNNHDAPHKMSPWS